MEQLVWQRHAGGRSDVKHFATDHEYILTYAKNQESIGKLRRPLTHKEKADYTEKDEHYATLGPYKTRGFQAQRQHGGHQYEIECPDGSKILKHWRWQESRFLQAKKENKIAIKPSQNGEWRVEYKLYQNEAARVLRSLLTDVERNSQARAQLRKIFKKDDMFDYPKPVGLIKHFLQFSTNPDSIVLDFFAGSCTTAQAVMELNQEDGGNRQFIMVQLPERTPDKSGARDAGFETIAEIGKERIRRVCQNVAAASSGEIGFRVFKLAASNYRTEADIETDNPQLYINALENTVDPLQEGWHAEDVLYEVALKEGYPLDSTIEPVNALTTNTVFRITAPHGAQMCHVCLDESLEAADIEHLQLSKDSVFICRDIALDDTLAANLALQCRLKTI